MINYMVKAYFFGLILILMKEIGLKIKEMELGSSDELMEKSIKVSGRMINNMAKGYLFGLIILLMKEIGLKIKDMELVSSD